MFTHLNLKQQTVNHYDNSFFALSCRVAWWHHITAKTVLTTEWLPWLQTSCMKRQQLCIVYFANCIRQPERKLPRPSTTWSCRYSNHALIMHLLREHAIITPLSDIVTTEHLRENHHKSIIPVAVVVTPSQMLWGLSASCKVWFGLRLLMQLTSNTKVYFS